jgi:hypothetical protein
MPSRAAARPVPGPARVTPPPPPPRPGHCPARARARARREGAGPSASVPARTGPACCPHPAPPPPPPPPPIPTAPRSLPARDPGLEGRQSARAAPHICAFVCVDARTPLLTYALNPNPPAQRRSCAPAPPAARPARAAWPRDATGGRPAARGGAARRAPAAPPPARARRSAGSPARPPARRRRPSITHAMRCRQAQTGAICKPHWRVGVGCNAPPPADKGGAEGAAVSGGAPRRPGTGRPAPGGRPARAPPPARRSRPRRRRPGACVAAAAAAAAAAPGRARASGRPPAMRTRGACALTTRTTWPSSTGWFIFWGLCFGGSLAAWVLNCSSGRRAQGGGRRAGTPAAGAWCCGSPPLTCHAPPETLPTTPHPQRPPPVRVVLPPRVGAVCGRRDVPLLPRAAGGLRLPRLAARAVTGGGAGAPFAPSPQTMQRRRDGGAGALAPTALPTCSHPRARPLPRCLRAASADA